MYGGDPRALGAVMDVAVWLRSLGLERYEAAFREHEIDETVLPSLTHETLKELGVTAVGHRLKLLGNRCSAQRREHADSTRHGNIRAATGCNTDFCACGRSCR
jgi:hypothetical protein